MSTVSNDFMIELLKEIRGVQKDHSAQLRGIKDEIRAIRTHFSAFHSDVSNLYDEVTTIDKSLTQVKIRLNLTDEPQ